MPITDPSPPPVPAPRHGYAPLTKVLHWTTVVALAAQFVVGYSLDVGGQGRGRGRGRSGESGRGRGRGRGGEDLEVFGDDALLTAHVLLGVGILALAVVRLWWRRRSDLPPWAEGLSTTERTVAHWVERGLYASLFAIPLTGLWLVVVSDDAVAVHVAAHLAFFALLTVHVAIVVMHTVVQRDGLLRRML